MKAKLLMVALTYDHSQRPNEFGVLPIQNIDVGKEIRTKGENEWVVPTHYREFKGDKLRQVAFRFDKPLLPNDRVVIHGLDEKNKKLLSYSKEYDIWYQQTTFSLRKQGRFYQYAPDQVTVGIANAGTVAVSIIHDEQLLNRFHINFVPSSLKISDYEEMVADLYRIHEELVRDERNTAQLAIRQRETYMQLEHQLRQLQQAITRINSQPHKHLTLNTMRKKNSTHGRFDLRAEIEEYVSPGQPTYRHRIMQETTVTYENKLMKQLLIDLGKYAELQSTVGTISQLENEQNDIFRKSDFRLQQLLGSIETFADAKRLSNVLHQLQREADQYLVAEEEVQKYINNTADFSLVIPPIDELAYVELTVECRGIPTYRHEQSRNGLYAYIKYDNREIEFKTRRYSWQTAFGLMQTESFASYYGEISLNSSHVLSHVLLYEAFHHNRLIKTNPITIVIKGYVSPILNGINPVATINPYNPNYNNYSFQFKWLTDVTVEGQTVTVPQTRPDLQAFLNEKLPIRIPNIDAAEEAEMRLKQLNQLIRLEQEKNYIHQQVKDYKKLKETVDACLALPLFQNVKLKTRLVSCPTQLFLHEPNYRSAWQAIRAIEKELSASLYAQKYDQLIKTPKVEHIYEVWILYKILAYATQKMGWRLREKSAIKALDNYILSGQLLKNFSTTLMHGDWKIECFYEPRIDLQTGNYLTPDFVFRYVYRGVPKGLVILDAKYRDYTLQGNEQWINDVQKIAMKKYGEMRPIDRKWQLPILHSGIIHCDEQVLIGQEEQFNPYHVLYNDKLFEKDMSSETAHRYGSICMIPSQLHIFNNWFRMILEYHLKAYQICWHCGEETNISMRQLVTASGYPKYHYTCNSCHEFWVKVHCRRGHHHLVKHTLNYHLQVNRQQRWFVVCPCCGDGRLTR